MPLMFDGHEVKGVRCDVCFQSLSLHMWQDASSGEYVIRVRPHDCPGEQVVSNSEARLEDSERTSVVMDVDSAVVNALEQFVWNPIAFMQEHESMFDNERRNRVRLAEAERAERIEEEEEEETAASEVERLEARLFQTAQEIEDEYSDEEPYDPRAPSVRIQEVNLSQIVLNQIRDAVEQDILDELGEKCVAEEKTANNTLKKPGRLILNGIKHDKA